MADPRVGMRALPRSNFFHYRPSTKLWEVNVFTVVCLSTGGAWVSLVPCPFQGTGSLVPGHFLGRYVRGGWVCPWVGMSFCKHFVPVPLCLVLPLSNPQHRIQPGVGGPRNMNSMWPPLAAISFMTYLYRAGGPWPPRHPLDPLLNPGSATVNWCLFS